MLKTVFEVRYTDPQPSIAESMAAQSILDEMKQIGFENVPNPFFDHSHEEPIEEQECLLIKGTIYALGIELILVVLCILARYAWRLL